MVREFHETDETNGGDPPEIARYLEYDPAFTRNFDEVDEFHNGYHEFGMDAEPVRTASEEDKFKRRDTEQSDGSDPSGGSDPSAAAASSGSAASSATAAQVLATTFVALVAVSAVVVPALENTEVSVSMDVYSSGDVLGFYVYLENYSEDGEYWAYVSSGSTVYDKTLIENGYLDKSVSGLPPGDYTVEVRTGTPPLLVLQSAGTHVKGGGFQIDKLFTTSTEIYAWIILPGVTQENPVMISVTETATGADVFFEEAWEEGYDLHASGLTPDTEYLIKVMDFSGETVYVSETARTSEAVEVTVSNLSATMTTLSFDLEIPDANYYNPFSYTLSDSEDNIVYSSSVEVPQYAANIDSLEPESTYTLKVGSGDMSSVYYAQEMSTSAYVMPSAYIVNLTTSASSLVFGISFEGEYIDATVTVTSPDSEVVHSEEVTEDYWDFGVYDLKPSTDYTVTVTDFKGNEVLTKILTTAVLEGTVTATAVTATTLSFDVDLDDYQEALGIKAKACYTSGADTQILWAADVTAASVSLQAVGLVPETDIEVSVYYTDPTTSENVNVASMTETTSAYGEITATCTPTATAVSYTVTVPELSDNFPIYMAVENTDGSQVYTTDTFAALEESGTTDAVLTPLTDYLLRVYGNDTALKTVEFSTENLEATFSLVPGTFAFTYEITVPDYNDNLDLRIKVEESSAGTQVGDTIEITESTVSGTFDTNIEPDTEYTVTVYRIVEQATSDVGSDTVTTAALTAALTTESVTDSSFTANMTLSDWADGVTAYLQVYQGDDAVYTSDNATSASLSAAVSQLSSGTGYTVKAMYDPGDGAVELASASVTTVVAVSLFEATAAASDTIEVDVTLANYDTVSGSVLVRLYGDSGLIASSSQTSLSQTHTFSDGVAPGATYSVDVYDAVTENVVATETDIEPQAAAAAVTASETATTVTLNVVLANYCDTSDFVTVSLYKGADTTADPVYSATQTSATQDHVATDLVPSTTYTYVVYDTLMSAELAKDAVETGANTASVDSVDLAATRGMVTVSVDYYSEELGLYLQVTSTTPGDVAVGSSFDSDSLMYYFDISAGKSYVFTVYSGWDGSSGTVMLTSDEYAAPTAYIGVSDVPNTAVWNLTGAYGAVSLYIYTSSDGANPDSDVPTTMYELSSGSGSVDLTTLDGVTSGNYYIKVYSTTHSEVLPTSAGDDATCIVYVSSS